MVGCWCGYLSRARCRLAYVPADATVSCFSKIQIGFTFLVPAHLGSPGKRAVKRVCVCVCVCFVVVIMIIGEAEYCDERVCLSVCVSVCPRSHLRNYTSDLHQFFFYMLPMAVAQSSSGGVVTRYVLPVLGLWMASYLLISQGCSTSGAAIIGGTRPPNILVGGTQT